MSIEVQSVSKSFGEFAAIRDVSLRVETSELAALLGPSGSGKTTLLRVIAGLEQPETGTVSFDNGDATYQSVQDRRVGFVFQHYALFRHMTVFENVAFGLRVRPRHVRKTKEEISERVHQLLRLVQLDGMGNRFPSQLSGGQRQRVALARALAVDPKVLLLDEPFGSLDAKVRKELRRWLRHLHEQLRFTSIFVTHDQEEALEVADRVVIMNEGRIEQVGTPEEVYNRPANPFVCNFLGDVNLFRGRVEDGFAYAGGMKLEVPTHFGPGAKRAFLFVRPHLLEIARTPNGNAQFRAVIKHIDPAHAMVKLELTNECGETLHVELPQDKYHDLQLRRDEVVYVSPKETRLFVD